MVDQTKVETSEAKASELEKKVKNILIHKETQCHVNIFTCDCKSMGSHVWLKEILCNKGLVE